MMIQEQRGSEVQRRFIRLDEIEQKTTMTKGDVFAAIEQGQLPLCAGIEADNLGALTSKDGQKVLCAAFGYFGVVRLLSDVSKRLIFTQSNQTTNTVIVLEPDKVKGWRAIADAFPNIEESQYQYSKNAPSNPPEMAFAACAGLKTQATLQNNLGKLAKVFSYALSEEQRTEIKSQYPEVPSERLLVSGITIEPHALRVDLEDVQRVFGRDVIRGESQCLPNHIEKQHQTRLPLLHPIEQIIYRVLMDQPNAKSNHIWNLLRQECNSDEEPIYDIDALIESITPTTLTWIGRDETEKSMSYDSFRRNTVNGVRRFIRAESAQTNTANGLTV
ncbi:hypothetical protein [Vibrio navarrensis]|uniref:hypothetical protein n=1 Tax=Vibrio navarrensis TaxID=29495 RepID=UPI00186A7941|nr:hypothetical protein [Vibrio navarrensis]